MKKHKIRDKEVKRSSLQFWKEMIQKASRLDFREPMPEISVRFIHIWARHYAKIGSMAPIQEPILEVGAGYGVLAAGLGTLSDQKVMATEHPTRGYMSNPEYHDFLKSHGVELVTCNLLEGLPFENNSFKQVYFCDVIEHLNPDKMPFILDELHRVLMPGGKLILSTPNLNRLSGLFRFFAGHSLNPPLQVRKLGETYDHIRELAPKEILKLLFSAGFKPFKMKFITIPYFTAAAFGNENIFSPLMTSFINGMTRLMIRIIPRFGDEMYIAAEKPLDTSA